MSRKNAPYTPAAQTPGEALDNLDKLLAVRNAGWDRTAVRDIIAQCYGSTENFAKHHRAILVSMVKHRQTWRNRDQAA